MNESPPPVFGDAADSPVLPNAQHVMEDLATSEADEAAGRTDSGADLLARMDRAAVEIRAKIVRHRV